MIPFVYLIEESTNFRHSVGTFQWIESVWTSKDGAVNHIENDLKASNGKGKYEELWTNEDDPDNKIAYRIRMMDLNY